MKKDQSYNYVRHIVRVLAESRKASVVGILTISPEIRASAMTHAEKMIKKAEAMISRGSFNEEWDDRLAFKVRRAKAFLAAPSREEKETHYCYEHYRLYGLPKAFDKKRKFCSVCRPNLFEQTDVSPMKKSGARMIWKCKNCGSHSIYNQKNRLPIPDMIKAINESVR